MASLPDANGSKPIWRAVTDILELERELSLVCIPSVILSLTAQSHILSWDRKAPAHPLPLPPPRPASVSMAEHWSRQRNVCMCVCVYVCM